MSAAISSNTSPMIRVGTPCYGGIVTTDYMSSIINLMQYAGSSGFNVHVDLLGADSLITRARNTLLSRFIADSNASHFMFIDADIGFDPALVHRMLTFDEDIVAGIYPLKTLRWDAPPRIRDREAAETATLQYVGKLCEDEDLERRGSFATGRYCGTGFMLMKRRAIERLIEAHPESAYEAAHVYAPTASRLPSYALFECMIDPVTRTYLSEDFAFCQRWRDLGGKIWLDVEGSLTHTGPHHFVGRPELRFAANDLSLRPAE
jgi:hypothetical protein